MRVCPVCVSARACVCVSVSVLVCVCVCVCVCLCPSKRFLGKYHRIIKLARVTASDMRMHHVLLILTVIEGHIDTKYSIISDSFEAMPKAERRLL